MIVLPRKLPYQVTVDAQLDKGLDVLKQLLTCMGESPTSVPVAMVFQGPMARVAGWRGERYGVFIRGETGSLKTSWAQVLMSLYGPQFMQDALLLKLGQGATGNAVMALAVHAYDLPLLIDNYKPSTGGGPKELINLIHNIMEGGEKERLKQSSELRETKPVFCWPLFTGEDVPDTDPAALARLLLARFVWPKDQANEALASAQDDAEHFCAVGRSWLEWIAEPLGRAAIETVTKTFRERRAKWAADLRGQQADMVNVLRVASNLASNELTWLVMEQHPSIGPVLKGQDQQLRRRKDLERVAEDMGASTTSSLEAHKFMAIIRELLASGKAVLRDRAASNVTGFREYEPDRVIGWVDSDQTAYLLPAVARHMVDTLTPSALGNVSSKTLHGQMADHGMLQSRGRQDYETVVQAAGKSRRTLHVTAAVLST